MMTTYVAYGCFIASSALILSSAWLVTRVAYLSILVLFALGLLLAEISSNAVQIQSIDILVDLVIFGAVFYFVSVQHLLRRRFFDVVSRADFRATLEERNEFSRFPVFVYHLPIYLLIVGIAAAVFGKFAV